VKLIWASPTYGPVEPEAQRSQRAAIMAAANNGVTWVGDASPDKEKFDAARNHVVHDAFKLAPEADGVFWCDSDIILPPNAVRIAAYGHDFVTGMYFQKRQPYWPLVGRYLEDKGHFQWISHWQENVLTEVDGCGFGCVYTSMAMLRKIEVPYFEYNDKISEDLYFCLKAKRAGYQLYVDTGILCGHLPPPRAIGQDEFKQWRDSLIASESRSA
jgi:hypothetical protein